MDDEQRKQVIDFINIGIKIVPVLLSLIASIGAMVKQMDIGDTKREELIAMIEAAKQEVINLPEIL